MKNTVSTSIQPAAGEAAHAPTPFRLVGPDLDPSADSRFPNRVRLLDAIGCLFASVYSSTKAGATRKAKLIEDWRAKANAHAGLVAELERMTKWQETRIAHLEAGDAPDNSPAAIAVLKIEVEAARAALNSAKEI